MLAVPWPRPFSAPDWSFEVKWDGVRVMLSWDGEELELRSRRGRNVTATYPELGGFRNPVPCVLDGEVVAFNEEGRPSFQAMQGRMNLTGARRIAEQARLLPVVYMVFDLLYDGEDVTARPLQDRQARLDDYHLPAPCVRSTSVAGEGEAFFSAVEERGLEGMVAKRLGSPYRPGVRSDDWRKVARIKSVRAVVGGFTAGEGARAGTFGSLLLGLWEDGRLRYVGSVGTGFNDRTLRAVRETLDGLRRSQSPFDPAPAVARPVVWVEPQLVVQVECKEWTLAGRLRAPSFKGFTDDPVEAVTWEAEGPG
jgi:bifunctional non-homologous end joining protein LigD